MRTQTKINILLLEKRKSVKSNKMAEKLFKLLQTNLEIIYFNALITIIS